MNDDNDCDDESDIAYTRSWRGVIVYLIQALAVVAIIYCLARCSAGPQWFGVNTTMPIEKKL